MEGVKRRCRSRRVAEKKQRGRSRRRGQRKEKQKKEESRMKSEEQRFTRIATTPLRERKPFLTLFRSLLVSYADDWTEVTYEGIWDAFFADMQPIMPRIPYMVCPVSYSPPPPQYYFMFPFFPRLICFTLLLYWFRFRFPFFFFLRYFVNCLSESFSLSFSSSTALLVPFFSLLEKFSQNLLSFLSNFGVSREITRPLLDPIWSTALRRTLLV